LRLSVRFAFYRYLITSNSGGHAMSGSCSTFETGTREVSAASETPTRLPLNDWIERWDKSALPDWKLYSGYGVTGHAQIGRVVRIVDLACRAEIEGRVRCADFFWREAHRSLRASWSECDEWIAAAREVLWETHWALVRGGLRDKNPEDINSDERAFAHAAWIEGMADLLPMEASARREDLEAVLRWKLNALERAGRLEEATQVAQHLRRLLPEKSEYVSRAAELHMGIASRALEANPNNQDKREQALRSSITQLLAIRQSNRPNLTVLQAEAILRQMLAIHLANTERLSQALVESRRALTLDPYVEGGEDNSKKLVELMTQLQQQMESVRAELQTGNKQLTASGTNLMQDSNRGFGPLQEFIESDEHRELTEQHADTLAFHVWRAAGLPETESGDTRPKQFMDAMSEILHDPPETPSTLKSAWRRATESRPSLSDAHMNAGLGYLYRRLFPDDPDTPPSPNTEHVPKLGEGPVIKPASRPTAHDGEPFRAWLYSRCDLRIKVQCVLAVAFLIVAGSIGTREYLNRGVRTDFYSEARIASSLLDPQRVMDASAQFLRHDVLSRDKRQAEMTQLYDESLVNWLVRENPSEEQLQRRLKERKSLSSTGRSQ
jgi:hypothetical protein